MAELSEWLRIMLGEVARKNEEESCAAAENAARAAESAPAVEAPPSTAEPDVR